MRIAAIILAALGMAALDIGILLFSASSLFLCPDSCASIVGLDANWLSHILTCLSLGAIVTLISSMLAIASLAGERRPIALNVAIAPPLITAGVVALIIRFAAGGFVPAAGPTLSGGTVLISGSWIGGVTYAGIPLALWPPLTLLTLIHWNTPTSHAQQAGLGG